MYNRIILVGNLTRDVETRYLPNGTAVAKCGIATSRKYKDQSGNQKEETLFIDFTLWGRSAEIANQYLHKGSKVLIEGRLTLEQWTDQNGQKRSKHSVAAENLKMLDGKSQGGQAGGQAYNQAGQASQQHQQPPAQQPQPNQQAALPEVNIDDSEIPF